MRLQLPCHSVLGAIAIIDRRTPVRMWDSELLTSTIHHHNHRQNSHFAAIAFLKKFCQACRFLRELDNSVSTFLNFARVILHRARSSALSPTYPTWRTRSLCLCLQWRDGPISSLGGGFLFVTFYYPQDCRAGILTRWKQAEAIKIVTIHMYV
jgi:hypothetical protein